MLVGLSTAITQFTYAFGPGLLGLVRDLTGSYTAPLLLCVETESDCGRYGCKTAASRRT